MPHPPGADGSPSSSPWVRRRYDGGEIEAPIPSASKRCTDCTCWCRYADYIARIPRYASAKPNSFAPAVGDPRSIPRLIREAK
jgi:hypothetical protein